MIRQTLEIRRATINDTLLIASLGARTFEASFGTNNRLKDMEQYLGQLKEEYQDVLILRYIDGYSIGEIALMMGKKEGAVRVLLHRALQTLREKMAREV